MSIQQVDYFAFVAINEKVTIALINGIDSHVPIDIKDLGLPTWYDRVDITQTKYLIKRCNETYEHKLIQEYECLMNDTDISNIHMTIKMNQHLTNRKDNCTS